MKTVTEEIYFVVQFDAVFYVILSLWERVEYPLMLVEEVLKPLHYTQMWIHVWVLLLTPLY